MCFVDHYRPQHVCGKVIFSQTSVILSPGGCLPQCMLPPWTEHWDTSPWADAPLDRHPQADIPADTYPIPWADTLWADTPGQTPPGQTPIGQTPPVQIPPWADAPRQTPPSRHLPQPLGRHLAGQTPPPPGRRLLQLTVRILLECILVFSNDSWQKGYFVTNIKLVKNQFWYDKILTLICAASVLLELSPNKS